MVKIKVEASESEGGKSFLAQGTAYMKVLRGLTENPKESRG